MPKPRSPGFSSAEARGCMDFAGKMLGIPPGRRLPPIRCRRIPPRSGFLPPGPAEFAKFALCPEWTARRAPGKWEIEFNSLLMRRLPREVLNGLLVRECAKLLLEGVDFRYPRNGISERERMEHVLILGIVLTGISEYCRKRYEERNASPADIAAKRSLGLAAHSASAFLSPARFCRTTLEWALPSEFRRHVASQGSPSPLLRALFHHPEADGLGFFEYMAGNSGVSSAPAALRLASLFPPRSLYHIMYPLFYLREARGFLRSLGGAVEGATKG